MIPPRNVNLAACQDAKDRFPSPEGPCGLLPARGWQFAIPRVLILICGKNQRWNVSEPLRCNKVSETPLAIGRWLAVVAPGFLLPALPPSPRGLQPRSPPRELPYWLVIATFSRWRPRWIALRTWGKRDAKSRGEHRRKAGVPY